MFGLFLYLIGCGFLWVVITPFDPKVWPKARLLRIFIFLVWLWWTYFTLSGGIANLISKIGSAPF
jgi:hypothetical protein|tara:strand:+ start:200 stop:394 length:195 start_codon:yes stop_codon:yes gene_type:complete